MKSYLAILSLAVLAAVVFVGCTTVPGTIQDKTKPLAQNGYTVVGPEVSATEAMVSVFGFSVSDMRGSPSRRMYQKALSKAPGADALIEYSTDIKKLNLVFVNVMWYTVTGTPVKTK